MIIQGQNEPIIVELTQTISPTKLHALLYDRSGKKLKHWELADVTINENMVILPISESESVQWPACKANFEMKWLNTDGIIDFVPVQHIDIEARQDRDLLTGGGV